MLAANFFGTASFGPHFPLVLLDQMSKKTIRVKTPKEDVDQMLKGPKATSTKRIQDQKSCRTKRVTEPYESKFDFKCPGTIGGLGPKE